MKGFIADFDHAFGFSFRYSFSIDREEIFEAAGLPEDAIVAAYAIADCQPAGVRLAATTPLTEEPVQFVDIPVPPGTLAGAVQLGRGLTLVGLGSSTEMTTAASKLGARLLTSEFTSCRLEGDWSRFPLEAAHFANAGLPDVPWHLSLDMEDLEDSFLGSARLLINADHPAGMAVLGNEATDAVLSALRVDLVRQLILSVAAEQPDSHWGFPDDSIGGVVSSIASDVLKSDLASVCLLIREEPVQFEQLLHDRLNYLWEHEE